MGCHRTPDPHSMRSNLTSKVCEEEDGNLGRCYPPATWDAPHTLHPEHLVDGVENGNLRFDGHVPPNGDLHEVAAGPDAWLAQAINKDPGDLEVLPA